MLELVNVDKLDNKDTRIYNYFFHNITLYRNLQYVVEPVEQIVIIFTTMHRYIPKIAEAAYLYSYDLNLRQHAVLFIAKCIAN